MNLEANRRLAGLLGWTNIVDVGGALLGAPPPGEAECRGQAKVPDWTGDWRECGPLIAKYHCMVECFDDFLIVALLAGGGVAHIPYAAFGGADATTRNAIVTTISCHLESAIPD